MSKSIWTKVVLVGASKTNDTSRSVLEQLRDSSELAVPQVK